MLGAVALAGGAFGLPGAVCIPLLAGAALLLTDAATSRRCRRSMKVFGTLWPKVEAELYALPVALPRYTLLLAIVLAGIASGLAFGIQLWMVWPAFLAVLAYLGLFFHQMTAIMRRHRPPGRTRSKLP